MHVAMVLCLSYPALATQLSGTYTIDPSQTATTSNFKDFASAITYMTSTSARADLGPANSGTVGVSGPVVFQVAAATYTVTAYISIPAIPGVSAGNTVTFDGGNGNAATRIVTGLINTYGVIVLNGCSYVNIRNLTINNTSSSYGGGVVIVGRSSLPTYSNSVKNCVINLPNGSGPPGYGSGITINYEIYTGAYSLSTAYCDSVQIDSNTINGCYYGVASYGTSNATYNKNVKIRYNTINNVYYAGCYIAQFYNGIDIIGNNFNMIPGTGSNQAFGVYMNGCLNTSAVPHRVNGNRVRNASFAGIYFYAYSTVAPTEFYNNTIAGGFNYNGTAYGIYSGYSSSSIERYYHNTILFDNPYPSTGYGLQTVSSNYAAKNNMFMVTGVGTSHYPAYFSSTATAGLVDYNEYYNQNGTTLIYKAAAFTAANYRVGTAGGDSSYNINPLTGYFRNIAAGDLKLTDGCGKLKGYDLTATVPTDIDGETRSVPPYIGSDEYVTVTNDLAVTSINLAPPLNGTYSVKVRFKNAGSTSISGASFTLKVNNTTVSTASYSGTLAGCATDSLTFSTSYTFSSGTAYNLMVYSENPGSSADNNPANDTLKMFFYGALDAGTYTINPLGSGSSNFSSFSAAAAVLNNGGLNGSVTFNVVSGSGPYNEQLILNTIPGNSSARTVTINGNAQTLQYNNTALDYDLVRLNGAKFITISSLVIKALNTQYGWGIHLMNNADSNTFTNCTIDLTGVSSASTASAGIVLSSSGSTPTTAGENGKGNLFTGNTISGHVSGGPYYGIVNIPSNAATTASNNKFINNTIQNFYNMGIYSQYTNGTLYSGNVIRNNNRTSNTTVYGIYEVSGNRNDTIINNIIENPFGTFTTNTNAFYGINLSSPGIPAAANAVIIANNIIRNVRSNGVQYGIYGSVASYAKIYHNTIAIDDPNSTSSSFTYGFYTTSTITSLEFRNNIVYINRSASNTVYDIYIGTSGTPTINNNVYFKTGVSSNSLMGYYAGTVCNTFTAWRAVNSGLFDANSAFANPGFTNISTSDLKPREGFINNTGANLTATVPNDFFGVVRSTTPDPGAIEFNSLPLDASMEAIIPPAAPFVSGSSFPVYVKFKNSGTTTITSANIGWKVNGVAQTPYSWTGSLAGGTVSPNIQVGTYTFGLLTNYTIGAWTSVPNGVTDTLVFNDSAFIYDVYAVVNTGTYTLNKNAAASSSNFVSLNDLAKNLANGGVAGPVTVNTVTGSGPYTEQVLFNKAPGASVSNNITINGNNELVQFNNTDANKIYVIGLNDADYYTISNFRITASNTTYGVGVLFTNNADTNILQNCTIDISANTSGNSTTNAGIAFTGALNSVNTVPTPSSGAANIIQNNTINGGAGVGPYYGIVMYATNTTAPSYSNNRILNNTISDFYVYGIYTSYTTRMSIKGNTISRPTKASLTTFYGIAVNNGSQADTIENNIVMKPFETAQTNTGSAFGIYFASTNPQAATPTIVRNNIITDFKSSGPVYGIYSSTNAYLKIYNNTINFDHPTATSTNIAYGIYNTGTATGISIRNNIVNINRGGTGAKYALYFNTASTTGYSSNNNSLRSIGGTNFYTGYYAGTSYVTLTNWKATANLYDASSVTADPLFRTFASATFLQPGNDTLNNKGASLAEVPYDITGALRSSSPDIGAYEFSVPANDAGILKLPGFAAAVNPITLGTININATIKNYGKSPLSTANLNWSVDGAVQSPGSWSGYLTTNDTGTSYMGTYNFTTPALYTLKSWTSLPNSSADSIGINDSFTVRLCTPLSGSLTVNPSLPAAGTNFTTFASLIQALQSCGVGGPLSVNIAPGTYTTQLTIPAIPGASAVNKITFDGGDSALTKITWSGSSAAPATLLLNGVKNLAFRNITFEGTGTQYATAVQLMTAADSNSFVKCTFRVPVQNSYTTVNAFVASGSLTSALSSANSANYLLIDSCSATGGYYGSIVLYGASSPKAASNIVRNSTISSSYSYGMYLYYQNGITISKNTVTNVGFGVNTNAYAIALFSSDNGNRITGNSVSTMLGGYGIYLTASLGTSANRTVVANNMINYGAAANVCYGIYESNNAYTDIAFNTVKVTTAEAGYAGGAMYSNCGTPATYNNVRIVNNIFAAPNGCLSIYIVTPANTGTGVYTINNNVYYSTATYPFRAGGYITNTVNAFATSPNLLGPYLPGNNTHSQLFLPTFFSATNLRSISPQLDDSAMAISTVTDDFDGKTRSASTPDIGLYEFNKPANDAGATAIIEPVQPLVPGLRNVRVLVRNYGSTALSSVQVTYQIDTAIRTLTFTGTILPGSTDTAVFSSTSGPGSTSQQYNFLGNLVTIRAWTSLPNGVTDSLGLNDTTQTSLCGGLAGNYTINPLGSGSNNFISVQAAVDKLLCGGVYGPVVFSISPGTYAGQITIPVVVGTSATNTITFKSLTNVASSVTITSSTSTAAANYTLSTIGLQYTTFRNLTFENTNATYGRLISINKFASTNTNSSEIEFRECVFNGQNVASTADQYSLVYGPTGEYATNIRFINNTFNYGSAGITLGGQNIVNAFTPGLTVDTNTFSNQYYAALFLTNRSTAKIRNNAITLSSAYTAGYGIYISGLQDASDILRNTILNPSGTYGIFLSTNAYYAAPGFCTIANNSVNLPGTGVTSYGIYISSSSQVTVYNNTVKTGSSNSYGFYLIGNASFVNGVTTYPATNSIKFNNNIFHVSAGIPVYLDALGKAGVALADYNLYYTSGSVLASLGGTTYGSLPAARGNVYTKSDANSVAANVTFTSGTNLKPDTTVSSAWAVNGRGTYVFGIGVIPYDITGRMRSTAVTTGAPDIGAYEITPRSLPQPVSFTGSLGVGNVQYMLDYGDTVGSISWGPSGTLPSTVTARYFPGSMVSDPAGYGATFPADYMDVKWKIDAPGGSGYYYDIMLKYKPNMLGTVTSESDIRLAKKDSGVAWTTFGFSSTLDTINKTFGTTFLTNFSEFTGSDNTNPLPVQLSSFNAARSGRNALVTWTTASEINSSMFDVERSYDGRTFELAGEQKAAGFSNTPVSYQYTDVNPLAGKSQTVVYYRLKMTDRDHTFQYSRVAPVHFDEQAQHTVTVMPNPFVSNFSVSIYSEAPSEALVRLLDIQGTVLYNGRVRLNTGDNQIGISSLDRLAAGVYFLETTSGTSTQVTKLIKVN
jgi:hypothetical protein